ncbi:unnamed protein product [Amoebophrya sp. A120]|nr:unnamed protein product [Amoebophrya sp. A120]|eukprot:GSA120T00006911001.1
MMRGFRLVIVVVPLLSFLAIFLPTATPVSASADASSSSTSPTTKLKTNYKWKDVLPVDRPCVSLIDWWVSQPLFSFLDKPKAYPNFDAFPLQWDAYEQIFQKAEVFEEKQKLANKLLKKNNARILLEEYDDGTSQGHAVDGEFMYVKTFEMSYVDKAAEREMKRDCCGEESSPTGTDGLFDQTPKMGIETAGGGPPAGTSQPRPPTTSTSEDPDPEDTSDPVSSSAQLTTSSSITTRNINKKTKSFHKWKKFLKQRESLHAVTMQTHKPLHQNFCYNVLKNLLNLLSHFSDPQALGWRIQTHRSIEGKLYDQDVNYLFKRVQHDLFTIMMMTSVRFDLVHGVHPQILKPIFATLSHIARVRRNIGFQRCVSAVRAVDEEDSTSGSSATSPAEAEGTTGSSSSSEQDKSKSPRQKQFEQLYPGVSLSEMEKHAKFLEDERKRWKQALDAANANKVEKAGKKGVGADSTQDTSEADLELKASGAQQEAVGDDDDDPENDEKTFPSSTLLISSSKTEKDEVTILRSGKTISKRDRKSKLFPTVEFLPPAATGEVAQASRTNHGSEESTVEAAISFTSEHQALTAMLNELEVDKNQRQFQLRGLDYLYTNDRPVSYYGDLSVSKFRSAHWSYLGFAKEDLVEETYENCYLPGRVHAEAGTERETSDAPAVFTGQQGSDVLDETAQEQRPNIIHIDPDKVYTDTCCHLTERSEGVVLADAWAAFVQARRMKREFVDEFYRQPHRLWTQEATFKVDTATQLHPSSASGTLKQQHKSAQKNHTIVIHELFQSRFDILLLHHLENGADLAGAITLLRNELEYMHLNDMHLFETVMDPVTKLSNSHIPALHKWLESPLFPVLEKLALPSKLEDIPVSYSEVYRVDKNGFYAPRAVPFFYVLPQRDLIADAVRRKHALDCPVSSELEKYRANTDLFLEIGGFFGDCVIAAATVGWARYGVIELDGSRAAIKVLNKTLDNLFAKTNQYVKNYPAEYVFVHGVDYKLKDEEWKFAKIAASPIPVREEEEETPLAVKVKKWRDEGSWEQDVGITEVEPREIVSNHPKINDEEAVQLLDDSAPAPAAPQDDLEKISPVSPLQTFFNATSSRFSFPITLNAFDSGKFLARAAALFISDKSGWYRPVERKLHPGRNIAEQFAEGANSFTGLQWVNCKNEEYKEEMEKVLNKNHGEAAGISAAAPPPGAASHQLQNNENKISTMNYGKSANYVSPVSSTSRRPCMEFETVDGFLQKVVYPNFLALHKNRFPQTYKEHISTSVSTSSSVEKPGVVEHVAAAPPPSPRAGPAALAPTYQESFLESGMLRIGVRIKVSGTEDAVIRGMKETLKSVFWIHIAIMPECVKCDRIIKRILLNKEQKSYNFELVSEVRNNFREVLLLFQKKSRWNSDGVAT